MYSKFLTIIRSIEGLNKSFTRSTLNRNGLFITSGLYDTGYHGVMAGVLHVGVGPARIKQGTRIGQYLSFTAENLSSYDGDYGVGKSHDTKYA